MWDLGLAKHIHSVWLISGRRYVSGCCLTRFWWHVQSGCSHVQLCWCSKYFGKWQWVPKYSLCRVKAVNGYTYPLLQLCLSSSGSVVQRGVGGWKFPPLSNHNFPPPPKKSWYWVWLLLSGINNNHVPDFIRSNLRGSKFKIFLRGGGGMPPGPQVGMHAFFTPLSFCSLPPPTLNHIWNPDLTGN